MEHTDTKQRKREFCTLALTGGSGAGKGCVGAILEKNGIPVLDTDRVSRLVCEKGQPCLQKLSEAFGEDILYPAGDEHAFALNRKKLAALVFGEEDPQKRVEKQATLNRITHAYILDYCRDWLREKKEAGFLCACIDAPQLFESGFDKECDFIIGVTADRTVRIARIMARDGISREMAEKRIAAQHDDAVFEKNCDMVLSNNSTPAALEETVRGLLSEKGFI